MTTFKFLFVIILFLVEHRVLATTKNKERQNGRQINFEASSWEPELELAGSKWVSNFVDPETSVTEQEIEEEKIIKQHSRAPKYDLLGIFNTDEIRKYAFQYGKHLLQQFVNADYSKILYSPFTGDKAPSNEKEGTGRTTAASNYIVRWLLSLVRQEGVSLPVFLRSYRVEMLYDIVFYVLRWLFYAYLAFLYP